jgi:preprotein translocase subunit SecG
MARGWIAPSKGEQDLAKQVEASWGPDRKEKMLRRMAWAVVLVMMMVMAIFITMVTLQTDVEDNYAVVYSAPNELYIGQLDLSASGWHSFLTATTLTLTLTIPDWNVTEARDLTYFNRSIEGTTLHYLRLTPITGQVHKDVSRQRVEFTVHIEIVTPNAEVSKLKFLGNANTFDGTVTNHPSKTLVVLESGGKGVVVVDDKRVEVRNDPKLDNVDFWFLQFTRTKLS